MCFTRARDERGDKKVKTVTVGFVMDVFEMQAFVSCMNKDESFVRRWLEIEDRLESPQYQDDANQVSVKIHELFQELIDDVNSRFGALLPKNPEEMRK